jgi:hypothetical protein
MLVSLVSRARAVHRGDVVGLVMAVECDTISLGPARRIIYQSVREETKVSARCLLCRTKKSLALTYPCQSATVDRRAGRVNLQGLPAKDRPDPTDMG